MIQNSAWVLVTGVIRDEQFLLKRLSFLYSLKVKGYIDQVVFSTWVGEIDKFESISKVMKDYDFILVTSQEPDLVCTGHYLHQIVSLKNGLDACPDHSFILRTRTDKCGPESGFIDPQIESFFQRKNYIRPLADGAGLFTYRVGVQGGHTTSSAGFPSIFFWNDRLYFGYKHDLLKFINYDVLVFDFKRIIPEQLLFSYPFLTRYPIFNVFFEAVNQHYVAYHFRVIMENIDLPLFTSNLISFAIFKHAFLAERFLLHTYFFDITSERNFEFNSCYRGIDVIDDQDTQSYVDALFANDPPPILDNLKEESNQLVDFLEKEHSFPRVIQTIPTQKNHALYTPRVTVKLQKTEPISERLPLRLKANDPRLYTSVGESSDLGVQTTGKRGFLLHGPYIRLAAGHYEVAISAKWRGLLNEVEIDVVSNGAKNQHAKASFRSIVQSEGVALLRFSLTEICENLEVRVHVGQQTKMTLHNLEFRRGVDPLLLNANKPVGLVSYAKKKLETIKQNLS